ncbi:MAG: hypothetical protein HRT47_10495 [Candidatus Caenarcaniphilales bacterium]|nr:hypothetical protein [Candidatus Caenarcaniphilales bacterium]
MTTEHPYSQREMDIIIQNLTKDFTLAIQKLDSKIDSVDVKLEGKIDSIKVELNYLKILNTGIFIAIISSWIALYLQNK